MQWSVCNRLDAWQWWDLMDHWWARLKEKWKDQQQVSCTTVSTESKPYMNCSNASAVVGIIVLNESVDAYIIICYIFLWCLLNHHYFCLILSYRLACVFCSSTYHCLNLRSASLWLYNPACMASCNYYIVGLYLFIWNDIVGLHWFSLLCFLKLSHQLFMWNLFLMCRKYLKRLFLWFSLFFFCSCNGVA